MDIKKGLAEEHSKAQTLQIVDYVGVNKKRFKQLINIYLAGPYRITQRAAWPLSYCVQQSPHLIRPHLNEVIDFMKRPATPVAVRRNTMRLLQFIDIPKRLHGKVIDYCFKFLMDKKETVAVKVFSMTVLTKLIKDSPEIRKELKTIIEDQLPYQSAGFASRAKKILKDL